jgi:hypothetical protein
MTLGNMRELGAILVVLIILAALTGIAVAGQASVWWANRKKLLDNA